MRRAMQHLTDPMESNYDAAIIVNDHIVTIDSYRLARGADMPAELEGVLKENEYHTLQVVYKQCLDDATFLTCLTEFGCCLGTCCLCFWVFCLHPIFLRMFARDDMIRLVPPYLSASLLTCHRSTAKTYVLILTIFVRRFGNLNSSFFGGQKVFQLLEEGHVAVHVHLISRAAD
jgi:hypothetical protein